MTERKKAPPRKVRTEPHNTNNGDQQDGTQLNPTITAERKISKRPPRRAHSSALTTLALSVSDITAPTSPHTVKHKCDWPELCEIFSPPNDRFDVNRDYSYLAGDGTRHQPQVKVTAKNYNGYVVPVCRGSRSNDAVTSQQHIALDYDKVPPGSLTLLLAALERMRIAHIVYTTASHGKDGLERFRVVLIQASVVTDHYEMLACRVAADDMLCQAVPDLVCDTASFRVSQPMYLPVKGAQVWHVPGNLLDVATLLTRYQEQGLSVHVSAGKRDAVVPPDIDQIFAPVVALLDDMGGTWLRNGRMVMPATDEHASQYTSGQSKFDDFAFMFPCNGYAEVFNVSVLHDTDYIALDKLAARPVKKDAVRSRELAKRRRRYVVEAVTEPDSVERASLLLALEEACECAYRRWNELREAALDDDLADEEEDREQVREARTAQLVAKVERAAGKSVAAADKGEGTALSDKAYSMLNFRVMLNDEDAPVMPLLRAYLCDPGVCGYELAYDEFQGTEVYRPAGATGWMPVNDYISTVLREGFNRETSVMASVDVFRGMRDVVCSDNKIDCAIEWGRSLVWDGVPRIEQFYTDQFNCPDTPYHRAVALAMWTGMAGRLMVPGIKHDLVPVWVSEQGYAKTSTVEALAPYSDYAIELKLSMNADTRTRLMRGALVCELSEMAGFRGGALEDIKGFISARVDKLIPKFKEHKVAYPRRCTFIGTSNRTDFLHDETGERRWLPVSVGRSDITKLCAARDQLWAEAIALFEKSGIQYETAVELARDEHEDYKESDEYEHIIEQWIASDMGDPDGQGVTVADVALGALDMEAGRLSKGEQMRIGAALRRIGYVRSRASVKGRQIRKWFKR